MLKDISHEPSSSEARDTQTNETADHRRIVDDRPTECGFTREELRALVAEMIG